MRQPTPSATEVCLGTLLAHAVVAGDVHAFTGLFSTPVLFRAVTPRRFWDAETPLGVADIVLGTWFGPGKTVTDVLFLATETVGDVQKVTYRLAVSLESGPSVIEQVAYYTEQDGRITELRLACSGFRPV
jgi:hypothetical protein